MKNELFARLFPRLAKAEPGRAHGFGKVHGALSEFALQVLRKDVAELDLFKDLVTQGGEVNEDLLKFVRGYYKKPSTRKTEPSRLTRLIKDELNHAIKSGEVTPEMASVGLIDVDKLPVHLKLVWQYLRRVGGNLKRLEDRQKLPLTAVSVILFRVLIYVSNTFRLRDVKSLLLEHAGDVLMAIKTTVPHKMRGKVMADLVRLRASLDLAGKPPERVLEKKLPANIRRAIRTFRQRAPHGFSPYPELKAQKEKYRGFGDGKLSNHIMEQYIEKLVSVLLKLNLRTNASLEDLIVLSSRPIMKGDKVIGQEYFNPILEPYYKAERAASRPGYKEESFDSASFRVFLTALFAIARYNGEFDLPFEFRKHIKIRADKSTAKKRKSEKKNRFNLDWVDKEINRLKVEFDRIVKRKSFLKDKNDLRLCLFLPQLVVMRFLGFRQQCLRRCLIGKNIQFNEDGSITFYYARDEIKNGVRINQTLSEKSCDEIPGILLLIDVLTQYYQEVLPPIRKKDPKLYDEKMGKAFFGLPALRGRGSLIRKVPVWEKSKTARDARGNDGGNAFRRFFKNAAYEWMNFDELVDFPYDFTPHLMRGHCCDWLRKKLGLSWEAIAKAMGDKEETLKNEYYDEEEREQDAGEPFSEYNKKRKMERQQEERIANSVPSESFDKMQEAFVEASNELKEERLRTREAREEARMYKQHYEFVLERANLTHAEVTARLS